MPIIYHETDIDALKKILLDIYNISFNAEFSTPTDDKSDSDIAIQYIKTLQNAIDKCYARLKSKKLSKTDYACNSSLISQCIKILLEAFNECNNSFSVKKTDQTDDKRDSKIKKQCIEMLKETIGKYNAILKAKKPEQTDNLCNPDIEAECIKILLEAFNKCNAIFYAKKSEKTDDECNLSIEEYCIKMLQQNIDRCNTKFNTEMHVQADDECNSDIKDECIAFLQKAIDECNTMLYTKKPEQTADACEFIMRDQYIAILQEAIDKCNAVLPADVFNYLETENAMYYKFRANENLLKYVLADAVINLQKDFFCKMNIKERYYTSKRDFFSSFVRTSFNKNYKNIETENIEEDISRKKNNAYSNYSKLYNIAYKQCWLSDLACFEIPQNKRVSTEDEQGTPNVYVSKFLPNILGALVNKAKNCPYQFYRTNPSSDILYTFDAIRKYFNHIYTDEKTDALKEKKK